MLLLCQLQHEAGKKQSKAAQSRFPLLVGEVKEGDVVKEVNEPSYIDAQTKLL